MKGIVFTEFMEMVETRYSMRVADRIVDAARVPSGGAYTAVGTYDPGEMWSLLAELSKATELPIPELLRNFGEFLSDRFAVAYPALFAGAQTTFDLLEGIDHLIHAEVRKLYPDAELPHFEVIERTADRLVLLYESPRHFADLADGLIRGCGRHYGENLTVAQEALSSSSGSRVRFTITRSTPAGGNAIAVRGSAAEDLRREQ